ncbi:farnesyl-diphosphate farnesyltransferase [Blastomyces silverae]|uniref:Squalene synthase n=1 Tax=Blastomyces silverae TaxID=2060906 RepID=A0A0H1BQD5_9EURO|nr:farnesyl-diphosphate farnesyltransferase [Blastomyces silverae]
MPSARDVAYYLFHVQELRAIIRWMVLRKPVHPRDENKESRNLKECWRFLALTSRSFVAVCQELHPELLLPVVVFYLVLRSLDTIEDDMTIGIGEKEPLLRNFHTHIDDESWTFEGSGPDEKDREVLVKFDCVAREFNLLKGEYRDIIRDIAKGMGNGMADYARMADANANGLSVKTIKDYELYCHYVAGLVGEGLTRLFVQADFVDPALLTQKPELMESMAQLLQQTNIIRDIREDYDSGRYFWPEEVWSKYVDNFGDLFLPQNREKALQCSSEMVLMALTRADECLSYMAGVREQSTFNFVAIPQTMAIATLELCFQNPAVFDRNVKLSRGSACQIMLESIGGFQQACEVFRRYTRRIQRKNTPGDPHYLDINNACGKIERFFEVNFPEEAARRKAQKARKSVVYVVVATLGVITAVMAGTSWFRS